MQELRDKKEAATQTGSLSNNCVSGIICFPFSDINLRKNSLNELATIIFFLPGTVFVEQPGIDGGLLC